MRRTMMAALLALAWTADARAAAPQVDPAARPAVTVAFGGFAYADVHPADGDTFTVSRGSWSGTGNSYSSRALRFAATTDTARLAGTASVRR